MKSILLDHISQAYSILLSKYGEGVQFILAGDKNDLKLDNVLNLSDNLKQVVDKPTRLNPPQMLDPIITTLANFYQAPEVLPPLDPDPDKTGVPSDHWIPVMKPIDNGNPQPVRTYREVKVRPMPQSGINAFHEWIKAEKWETILSAPSSNEKAEILQGLIMTKLDQYCPEKIRKIASDDKPWFTSKLKELDRKKKREYRKNRSSQKYKQLQRVFLKKVATEKKNFKKRMIDDVITAKSSQWYTKLKRITNYDQQKTEMVEVEEIAHLSDKDQAEAIADAFSRISNE